MLTDAISGVAKFLTRVIDLFDENPERRRKRIILNAKDKLRKLERELDDLEKKIMDTHRDIDKHYP